MHNSSSNRETRIDDLQSVFCAKESPVVDVRPKRHVAGWPLRALRWCGVTSLNVGNSRKNAEENNDEEKYFLHGLLINGSRANLPQVNPSAPPECSILSPHLYPHLIQRRVSMISMIEERKYAIVFAATLLCARKLIELDSDGPSPAKVAAVRRRLVRLYSFW